MVGRVNHFFKERFGGLELVVVVLEFCHEERVEGVDGFEFEVEVIVLGDGCFQVDVDDCV